MDVLSELNNEPVLQEIAVVVLTSSRTGEEMVKSQGVDADFYIQKPIEPEDFLTFVQEIEGFWLSIIEGESMDH